MRTSRSDGLGCAPPIQGVGSLWNASCPQELGHQRPPGVGHCLLTLKRGQAVSESPGKDWAVVPLQPLAWWQASRARAASAQISPSASLREVLGVLLCSLGGGMCSVKMATNQLETPEG